MFTCVPGLSAVSGWKCLSAKTWALVTNSLVFLNTGMVSSGHGIFCFCTLFMPIWLFNSGLEIDGFIFEKRANIVKLKITFHKKLYVGPILKSCTRILWYLSKGWSSPGCRWISMQSYVTFSPICKWKKMLISLHDIRKMMLTHQTYMCLKVFVL